MSGDVTSIRLPEKDSALVDHFVGQGDFKSRSEFIRYAVKKTINEMILREFHEKLKEPLGEDDIERIQAEIKVIRRKLWKDYAKHLS